MTPGEWLKVSCDWCGLEFTPKPGKRFCSGICRLRYHEACRAYCKAMIDAGLLTTETLKHVAETPCMERERWGR